MINNHSIQSFNSIFNSKTRYNYSFKEFIHSNSKKLFNNRSKICIMAYHLHFQLLLFIQYFIQSYRKIIHSMNLFSLKKIQNYSFKKNIFIHVKIRSLPIDHWDTCYISDNWEQQYGQLHCDLWIKSDGDSIRYSGDFLDTQVSLAPTHVSWLVHPSVRWLVTLSDFQSLVSNGRSN